jgi:hypothetical protein
VCEATAMRRPVVLDRLAGAESRFPLLLAAVTVACLTLAGCGAGSATSSSSPSAAAPGSTAPSSASPSSAASPTAPASAPATPSASPTPSPRPTADPTQAPEVVVTAGTVTDRKSTSVSGSGAANVQFTRKGDFGVVVRVDCSRCRGAFALTAPQRMSPFGRTTAPATAEYLVNVFQDESTKQSVLLTASGRWKLTFLSWNTLPVTTGKQSGRGSRVLYLGDRAPALKITYKPRGKGDEFGGRLFTTSNEPLIFGNDEAFSETYRGRLPAVLAITTNGSWTVEPKK